MQITTETSFFFLQYCLDRAQFLFLHSGSAVQLLHEEQTPSSSRTAASGGERVAVCCPRVDRSVAKKTSFSPSSHLTDLLQQLPVDQLELHADRHLGDELVAPLLGHLLTAAQVNVADASAALEIGQRLVGDPVTD